MNNRNEQKLVNNFINKCIPFLQNKPIIIKKTVSLKKSCDLMFELTIQGVLHTFCLEVKSDKSTNRCNNVLLLVGDILKNRQLEGIQGNSFGLFMSYDSKQNFQSYFVKRIQQSYDDIDWDNFGQTFNCDYLFFYDEKCNECYYGEWKGFISRKKALSKLI